MKKILKKKYIIWGIIIIIIAAIFLFFAFKEKPDKYTTEAVIIGNVAQTVSATGQIKSRSSAALRFEISGIVESLYAEIGEKVNRGQLLAKLNTQELTRKLTQAQADLNSATVAVANADQTVADTKIENQQAIDSIYTDAPKTFAQILNYVQKTHASFSGFFNQSGDILSAIEQSTANHQLVINSKNALPAANFALEQITAELEGFPSAATTTKIDQTLKAIATPLQNMKNALSALIDNINGIKTGLQVSATTLETYKSTLATAQSNLNSALADEIDLRADLDDVLINNQISLNTAESTLRLKKAQEQSAQAAVEIAERNISDAYMRSPIQGIVAAKNKEIGELVTISDDVYRIIDSDDIEVVVDIPEVDIGQITAKGTPAKGTLDALSPDEYFDLLLTSIEPDQTMIDGVTHYKARFEFDNVDPRFRSGMSVNLEIVTNQVYDVIVVPRGAVKEKEGKSYVEIFRSQKTEPELREVALGLKGDSNVEVISGLTVGEVIVTSTNND